MRKAGKAGDRLAMAVARLQLGEQQAHLTIQSGEFESLVERDVLGVCYADTVPESSINHLAQAMDNVQPSLRQSGVVTRHGSIKAYSPSADTTLCKLLAPSVPQASSTSIWAVWGMFSELYPSRRRISAH